MKIKFKFIIYTITILAFLVGMDFKVIYFETKTTEAQSNEFCQTFPELTTTNATVVVVNETQNATVSASGYDSNDSASINVNAGDRITITLSGSASPGAAEGTVQGQIYTNSAMLFNQTVVGNTNGPAYAQFDYTIESINSFTTAEVESRSCDRVSSVSVSINVVPPAPLGFTCTVTTNNATVNPGSGTSYSATTSPTGGFNNPVNYTVAISPSGSNAPVLSPLTNSPQAAPYNTPVTTNVSTQTNTTSGAYTITFTGTSGSISDTCSAQLTVNPAAGDFELVIQPSTGILPNTNPNRSNIGQNVTFTVVAVCTGGFAGPITEMTASTTFSGVGTSLGATSLNCGGSTTLQLTNTGSIPGDQQSTIINTLLEAVTVSGSGQL